MSNDSIETNLSFKDSPSKKDRKSLIDTYSQNSKEIYNQGASDMNKIYNRAVEVSTYSLFFLIIFVIHESYHDSGTTIQKEITSLFDSHYYNSSCQIIDSYDGNLDYVNNSLESSQFTFIYLYAHWCARSHKFKKLIEKLTCKYSNKISFIAVNCFNPSGSCRKTFDLSKYPHIVLQIRNAGLFTYQGPFQFEYVSRYLDLMLAPLHRIDNLDEFANFIIDNDGAVIGNFNFTEKYDNDLYNIFYQSAIKTYHTNFENPTRYAVIVNNTVLDQIYELIPKVNEIQNKFDKKINLFTAYGLQKNYQLAVNNISVDGLTQWVKKSLRPTNSWLYPEKYDMSLSSRNLLLIFTQRNRPNDQNGQINRKEIGIIKYTSIEHRLITMNIKLPYRRNKFLNLIMDKLELIFNKKPLCSYKRLFYLRNSNRVDTRYCQRYMVKSCSNIEFMKSFDIYMVDKNLYENYAHNLLNGSVKMPVPGRKPIILFANYKNESLYSLDSSFNYKNLNQFIMNQSIGINQRIIKKDPAKANEINSITKLYNKDLSDTKENLNKKDLLIFYYANWCGHCKLFNFKLTKLMHKYFRNIDSIKLLKVNVDSNDLPWHIQVHKIPTLIYLPAYSSSTNKQIDSIVYENQDSLNIQDLLNFILLNSKNPQTIQGFFKENFINSNNGELNTMLTNLISSKLNKLQLSSAFLNTKIVSLFNNLNRTNLEHLTHTNFEFNKNENMFFNINNDVTRESNYDLVFLKRTKNSLIDRLDKYINEISLLKQFKAGLIV